MHILAMSERICLVELHVLLDLVLINFFIGTFLRRLESLL
jgi:hypothetical protein